MGVFSYWTAIGQVRSFFQLALFFALAIVFFKFFPSLEKAVFQQHGYLCRSTIVKSW